MSGSKSKCSRCRRPYRGRGEWNVTFKAGVPVGLLCPRCQTPEENVEATVNEAVYDYGSARIVDGRAYLPLKGDEVGRG